MGQRGFDLRAGAGFRSSLITTTHIMSNAEKIDTTADEMLDVLPDAAREAYESGGSWREEPDTVEAFDGLPSYDVDRKTWDLYWIERAYSVEGGALRIEFVHIDQDGNRFYGGEAKWGTERHAELNQQYSHEKRQERWEEYREWVRKNGEDPLGEFMVSQEETTRWRLALAPVENGVMLFKARRISAETLPVHDGYIPYDETPRQLWQFLGFPGSLPRHRRHVPETAPTVEFLVQPDMVERLEDLEQFDGDSIEIVETDPECPWVYGRAGVDSQFIEVEIEEPLPPSVVRERTREKAQ